MNVSLVIEKTSFKCLIVYYMLQFWNIVIDAVVEKSGKGDCISLKPSVSEDVLCKLNGEIVSCDAPKHNTTAIVRCKDYYISKNRSPIYQCQNGAWNRQFIHCIPECGIKNVGLSQGKKTKAATIEYPWFVAVYNSTNDFICGGTIISERYILSAAHCFTTASGEPKKENFTIIAGKTYRDPNVSEDSAQIRNTFEIYVHENYAGDDKKYHDDIALVKVNKDFIISMDVRPVCIDWDNTFENFDFIDGTNGIVVGWSYTQIEATLSNTLKEVIMSYSPPHICSQYFPKDFVQEYFGSDKICASHKNKNITACKGASGGGLYFQSDKHYYIRGIVSITARFEGICNPNSYSLYTKVSRYLPWINITTELISNFIIV